VCKRLFTDAEDWPTSTDRLNRVVVFTVDVAGWLQRASLEITIPDGLVD